MGQDCIETRIAHDFDDFLADHLFRGVAYHSGVSFAYEKIAQIGTATSEQKWRIRQDGLSVISDLRHSGVLLCARVLCREVSVHCLSHGRTQQLLPPATELF
jgi:hypothetical protein